VKRCFRGTEFVFLLFPVFPDLRELKKTMRFRPSYFLLFGLLLLLPGKGDAQFIQGSKKNKPRYQLMAYGALGFYSADSRVTASTSATKGYGASFRVEYPIAKGVKLMTGLEVMAQGVDFESYYFAPGYSTIADKSFGYQHSIRTAEVGLPILFKINTTKKSPDDLINTIYFTVGWEVKYNFQSHSTITSVSDGSLVYDGPVDLSYESEFLGHDVGNYLVGGIGLNHNFLPGNNSIVFDITYRYGVARYVYTGKQNSNLLPYRASNLSFGIGFHF
jgi:hypothetical protein